ncbi:MAG: PIN domain-containing protein [Vulcanimicrobiota bacterium]
MTDKIVVDTNVLVYAYGEGPLDKRTVALELLDYLMRRQRCVLPCQVLAEFFNVITRKGDSPMKPAEARLRIENLLRAAITVDLSPLVVLEAARGVQYHCMSYYDAQIWAAARLNQIPRVVSEDFASGSSVDGIRFIDPFEPGFSIAQL